jgi:hypothetical protein
VQRLAVVPPELWDVPVLVARAGVSRGRLQIGIVAVHLLFREGLVVLGDQTVLKKVRSISYVYVYFKNLN